MKFLVVFDVPVCLLANVQRGDIQEKEENVHSNTGIALCVNEYRLREFPGRTRLREELGVSFPGDTIPLAMNDE